MKSSLLLETIRIEKGKALHLSYHNQRFNKTRKKLFNIHSSFDLATIIKPPNQETYRCRILYDREIQKIEFLPYQPKPIQKIALISSDLVYPFKYADRTLFDKLLTASPECDEILIVRQGFLTDVTIANIAFLQEGQWITPDRPLLEGTTRRRLIDEGFLTPKTIREEEIDHFDGFALMNAMLGFKVINPIWVRK